jgi:hypothetical protein
MLHNQSALKHLTECGMEMMFFVPPEKRMDVVRALNRFEGQVSNCHFTKYDTRPSLVRLHQRVRSLPSLN